METFEGQNPDYSGEKPFNFLASLINGNIAINLGQVLYTWSFNFLASLINGNIEHHRTIWRNIF